MYAYYHFHQLQAQAMCICPTCASPPRAPGAAPTCLCPTCAYRYYSSGDSTSTHSKSHSNSSNSSSHSNSHSRKPSASKIFSEKVRACIRRQYNLSKKKRPTEPLVDADQWWGYEKLD